MKKYKEFKSRNLMVKVAKRIISKEYKDATFKTETGEEIITAKIMKKMEINDLAKKYDFNLGEFEDMIQEFERRNKRNNE